VGSASDNTGGTIWFLSFALIAFLGGLLVLVDRRRRRLF
jgi:LPXTG-motif cell wall-anchored protein